MLLKKQTVWLLTMLSLVVVLSVYYVTSDPSKNNLATIGQGDVTQPESKPTAAEQDLKILTEAAGDEVYETVRMDVEDKRGKEVTNLTTQVGSPELTAEEKDKLYAQMKDIQTAGQKEKTVESLIKGLGYEDALVTTDGNEVLVTVKSTEEHSRAAAAKILSIVHENIGTEIVSTVKFDGQ